MKRWNQITVEYGVPNGTLAAWLKKYSEECKYQNPQTISAIMVKEMRDVQKRLL